MSKTEKQVYEFGPFRIDPAEHVLRSNGVIIPLAPKVFDTLLVLVENSGSVVQKEDIIKRVWPETFVEEGNLALNISTLRKVLGDGSKGHRFIETIPKRGYRFVAEVRIVPGSSPAQSSKEGSASAGAVQTGTARADAVQDNSLELIQTASPEKSRLRDLRSSPRYRRLAGGLLALAMLVTGGYLWQRARQKGTGADNQIRTFAVLPFQSLSPKSDEEYLSLGLADDLITKFSRFQQLVVRPIGVVWRYSGGHQDPILAGRELRTDAVLDGSIQLVENRIRVTVRLLNVRTGSPLWAGQFDEKLANILDLQDSLSERIAHSLEPYLVGTASRLWNRRSTRNSEAFHLYHQGRFFWNKSGKENCEKARTFFQQAISKDPNYALAYAGLADCYVHEGCGSWPRHERIRQARHWAMKALELDDGLAEAHATLGTVLFFYDWNRLEAEREFLRAIERNPSYANARHLYSFALAAMGRGDDALAQAELALESDAASVVSSVNMGAILYHLRKFDKAIAQLESCLKMETDFEKVSPYLALAYLEVGRYSEAMEAFSKTLASPAGLVHLGYGFARTGQLAQALKILTTVQEQVTKGEAPANHLTFLYLGLGENDMAFRWLEKEFEDRAAGMMYLKTAAFYDPIRGDSRFLRLLRRVGLEP